MNLYDIVADIIGYENYGTQQSFNSTILNICGILIVLFVVWFCDVIFRTFFRQ